MSQIAEISRGLASGRQMAEQVAVGRYRTLERHIPAGSGSSGDTGSVLYCGDNLELMSHLLEQGYAGRFRTIYIDPPFFTKSSYNAVASARDAEGKLHRLRHLAYDDIFGRSLESYVSNMTARMILMRELLADDGLLWVHLDWHSSHYLRLVLDELYGPDRFRNEIIWTYKSGGSGKRHFARKHDTILLYSKSKDCFLRIPQEKSYNRGLKPYRFKGVQEYRDETGWYTMVNMKDVWSIDMVGRTSGERNGYATQKPLELMCRILEASSEPGDLVGDFFCGSGSFQEAAERLGRIWIGCDMEEIAVSAAKKRLDHAGAVYEYRGTEDQKPVEGCLRMELVNEEAAAEGKYLCTYRIADFRPEIDYGYLANQDRETARQLEQNDPLALIDRIMIDPEGEEPFTVRISVPDGRSAIEVVTERRCGFLAVDIFGKEYLYRE
ncbi:MAG: site-specific DNA-methyltransferase [Mogibacterium sp.]|nr:site-specific DNA-methyltransferase [Mogibacterium sp.]